MLWRFTLREKIATVLFEIFAGFCYDSRMKEKTPETEEKVKLEPFLGIRPGVYLTVLYSVIIAAILFFLLFFPGIVKPGAVLTVKTEPEGAAIRVDDVYMGTSRDKIFVSKGFHTLQAVLPGFEAAQIDAEIPARLFGSLFFPRRFYAEFTLKSAGAQAVFTQAAADFAAWSFGGEPTASWQIPLVLSEGAYRIGPEAGFAEQEILLAASRFTVTRAAMRDIVRAKILLDNGGLSPSPASLTSSISDILVFLSENPGSAAWLSSLLPPESAAVVKSSAWYKNENSAVITAQDTTPARRRELIGLNFTEIQNPDGSNFLISDLIPRYLFNTFLEENPEWQKELTEHYPDLISASIDTNSGVSWFAAEAFCRWLSGRLPASMSGMEARLPTEAEWEYAALSNRGIGFIGWEWCADPFAPLPFISAPERAVQAVGSTERTLRSKSVQYDETRASLPPELSSPSVVFRTVIAPKKGQN